MKQTELFLKTCLSVLLTACFSLITRGQSALSLSKKEIDFGKISSIAYPAKTVEFTNTGNSKLAILLIEKSSNVKASFEKRFYQPGEKGIIYVYYDVRNLGQFEEDLLIYSNLDNTPQTLKIKGSCVSVQECFPNAKNFNLRNVSVIDKITQAPVPLATLTFVYNHNNSKPAKIKMDREGKAVEEFPIGLYNIAGNVNGYEPYASELFVPKTMPSILIELTPKNVISPLINEKQSDVAVNTPSAQAMSVDLPENRFAANNIILLLDVSTSMKSQKKFSLLQQSINNLVLVLRPIDNVTIITYASDAKVVLPSCPGNSKEKITGVVQDLVPSGTTQGVKGLNMAYELGLKQYIKEGNNQIILATDGEFSEKGIKDDYYEKFINDYAQKGIKLSILGFGVNQTAIDRMKKMTTYGNGSYIHIDSEKFAKDVLIEEIRSKSMIP
jgi:hypothetical protein